MAGDDGQRAPSRKQLILVGVGVVALIGLIFLIWLLILRTPMVPAFTELKPADAALIVDELERQKVDFRLENNGSTILLPQDQVDAARVAILGGDLPLKGIVGFEVFGKSDMGLTEFAQKINYQRALQGELARTLMSMSTIESARVHITLPETGVFQADQRPAKASATITPKLGAVVDARTVIGIQRLVASAVDDLEAGNVVVLDGGGKQLSGEPLMGINDPPGVGGSSVEQAYAAKVRPVLQQLVPDPGMRITVIAPARNPATNAEGLGHPLRVRVALAGPVPADLREKALPLLKTAIDLDPAAGDTLDIVQLPPSSPYDVGAPVASAAGLPVARGEWLSPDEPALGIGWIVLAVLVAVAAALLLSPVGKSLRPRQASADFATRLRRLLDQETEANSG